MPIRQSPSASPSAFATFDKVAARTSEGALLFDNLSLTFGPERTGVVGRNGAGKSTLLRLIAGEAAPTGGVVVRSGTVGVLHQRYDPAPDETVARTLGVDQPMAVVTRILAGEASERDLEEADWTLQTRLDEALAAVGLGGLALNRPTASLSGGEQTRLRLAALMMARPDLLLLDEPTNHLDVDARARVAEIVGRWKGGVVAVSHDRSLLRQMDRIVEVASLGVSVHGGGYDAYVAHRAVEREAAARDLVEAERNLTRIGAETQRRNQAKARRDSAGRRQAAKGDQPRIVLGRRAERAENSGARDHLLAQRMTDQAQSALAEAQSRVERTRNLAIPMPPTGLAAGRTVLALDRAVWRAPDGRVVVGPIDLKMIGPERVAVTGANGAGKTSLLLMAAGILEPSEGRVERSARAVLLDQEAALLQADETVIGAWRRLNPGASDNHAHAALARFLFRNTAAHRRVGVLSGGERLRAALACVLTGDAPPQLLILDEPTNHLDLDSIAAVEEALNAYDGAILVVSHDTDFLAALNIDRKISL